MIDVLLAAPEIAQEPELVSTAAGCGVRVLRRCVDAVDVLAAAALDPAVSVVVSAGLPRLSPDAVESLAAGRLGGLVGLAAGPHDAARLAALGVPAVTTAPTANATWVAIRDAVAGLAAEAGVWSTGAWRDPDSPPAFDEPADRVSPATAAPTTAGPTTAGPTTAAPQGSLIAVWGPMGAPGRSTVAIGVAEALAQRGRRVCLVDADTYAPSLAMSLGILDDGAGILRACRQSEAGALDASRLPGLTHRVSASMHVLTGIPRTERWSDLRPGALDRLWAAASSAFDVTVVDVGFCLEDAAAVDAWAQRRNASALTVLAVAHRVIAVADGSPHGAARLVAAWPTLLGATTTREMTVVRNRARRRDSWIEAVRERGIDAPIHSVPADPKALEACSTWGRTLGEGARRSPVRRSLVTLAETLMSG